MSDLADVRLSAEEIALLKTHTLQIDPDAMIYLFGSRCDPSAKGGDIDILILSEKFTRKEKRELRLAFFERFGEQKLDILIDSAEHPKTFTRLILKKAISL